MSASQDLSESIEAWLKRRQNASLGLLSKVSHVSYATVRRIASCEGNPSFEKALAIAAVTMDDLELDRFIRKHFATYSRVASKLHKPLDGTGIQDFLVSKDHAVIIALAATDTGTTDEHIRKILGEDGMRALAELITSEIIEEKSNGRFFAKESMFTILNPETLLNQIRLWAGRFDFENLNKEDAATYFFGTEGLNEAGIKELTKIYSETSEKVTKLVSSSEYRGDRVTYFAHFSNMVTGESGVLREENSEYYRYSFEEDDENAKYRSIAKSTQMLAHDVRRPLSMAQILLESIRNSSSYREIRSLAEAGFHDIKKAISSVDSKIKDVMQIDSSDAISPEPIEVTDLLFDVLSDVFSYRDNVEYELCYDFAHAGYLHVDREKMKRVFSNIIVNALEAANGPQKLWFFTKTTCYNEIELTIGNSGSFIPEEKIKKIFTSHYTEGKPYGTGIGLAITRKFVEAHNGMIWCQSTPGIGVEFVMTLPAVEESSYPQKPVVLPKSSSELSRFKEVKFAVRETDSDELVYLKLLSSMPWTKANIIVCDDDDTYINSLTNIIRKYPYIAEKINLKTFNDPNAICDYDADLYILDYDFGSGKIDGLSLAENLRKHGTTGLICMHSNILNIPQLELALTSVVEACMAKPISSDRFLQILHEAIELREARIQDGLIKAGDFTLNKMILIEDDSFFQKVWRRELGEEKVTIFNNFSEFQEAMPNLSEVDCIVTDYYYDNGENADSLVKWAKLEKITLPVFLYTNSEIRQQDVSFFAGCLPKSPDAIEVFKSKLSALKC